MIKHNPMVVLDGGMGRELHRRGAPFRQPEWSALALTEAPEIVQQTHADFIRAGAQVITANSYAIVPFHIGSRFDGEAQTLAATAGRLARAAADNSSRPVQVAASLPPLFGSYCPEAFDSLQAPRLAAPLLRGLAPYADIWLAETVSSLTEAAFWRSIVPADGKPFWLSLTLDDGQARLRSGETVAAAAVAAQRWGMQALLFNCSRPEVMADALREAKSVLRQGTMRLGVYANAFAEEENDIPANDGLSRMRRDNSPDDYLHWAQQWAAAGADIIGGCCGIGPEHIARLAEYFQAA